jgi:hypothetical protein
MSLPTAEERERPMSYTIRNIPLRGSHPNPNMRELIFNHSGSVVFFSYRTPVAAKVPNPDGGWRYLQTLEKYSVTTTKHINNWIGRQDNTHGNIEYVDQKVIDALIPQDLNVG